MLQSLVSRNSVFVVEIDTQSEHRVIRGDKGKYPEEGIPEGLLEEVTSTQDKRGRREGFRHKGRGTWLPSFLSPAVGH